MPCYNDYSPEIDEYIKEFLIDYFGLTFVTQLMLGGIAQETLFSGNKELEEMQLKGEEIIRAASIVFFLNFHIKPTLPFTDIQQKEFMQVVNTRRSTKLVGDPSAQPMDDWIKSIPTNPVIMNYAVKGNMKVRTLLFVFSEKVSQNGNKHVTMLRCKLNCLTLTIYT